MASAAGWGSSAGYVYRTTDGGSSWSAVHVGTSKDYLVVDFVDDIHGWASGLLTGDLWRTTNGGTSWILVHHFAEGTGSRFVDADHGWAFSNSNGNESVASVLATSDGGRQWKVVRRLPDQDLGALYAQSRSSCVLIGSAFGSADALPQNAQYPTTLATTTDGDTHWTTARVGVSVSPWSIAGNGGDSLCAVGHGILTSSDEGARGWRKLRPILLPRRRHGRLKYRPVGCRPLWRLAAQLRRQALDRTVSPGALLAATPPAVSFPDASNGWVVGGDPFFPVTRGVILHTTTAARAGPRKPPS